MSDAATMPIDLDGAYKLLTEAIAANPTAVNPRVGTLCLYSKVQLAQGEAPRCMVGEVLNLAGLPVPNHECTLAAAALLNAPSRGLVGAFTRRAEVLLQAAQDVADDNYSWEACEPQITKEYERLSKLHSLDSSEGLC